MKKKRSQDEGLHGEEPLLRGRPLGARRRGERRDALDRPFNGVWPSALRKRPASKKTHYSPRWELRCTGMIRSRGPSHRAPGAMASGSLGALCFNGIVSSHPGPPGKGGAELRQREVKI